MKHINMNGLHEEWKRRKVIEEFVKGEVDLLCISEANQKECGVWECGSYVGETMGWVRSGMDREREGKLEGYTDNQMSFLV